MHLDVDAASAALIRSVAEPMGLDAEAAAAAVIEIATENMVQAIVDITINQGIDPASAVLIGGGGAAGLNSVLIARRLGCDRVIIPRVGAALSAAGAMMSDLSAQFRRANFIRSGDFDHAGVNDTLSRLEGECQAFIDGPGQGSLAQTIEFFAEARYASQVWEIEVPLSIRRFAGAADVDALVEAFHRTHEEIFAIRDQGAEVEVVAWVATVSCRLRDHPTGTLAGDVAPVEHDDQREVYFVGHGRAPAVVRRFDAMAIGAPLAGPAVIEAPFTTIVIDPGAVAERLASGSIAIDPQGGRA
jgi:N-methylhydantoinase A